MGQHEAVRTLVKSAPELWDVCSDPDSLGRHLEAFGEIRITRVEPETTVAWEGDRVSGTVRIEPSGWGTRVTLTASSTPVEPEVAAEPEPVAAQPEPAVREPEPVAAQPEPEVREPEPRTVTSQPEAEGPELSADPVEPEPEEPPVDPEPAAPAPRRGVFRRLGALLFRSFVTPVEVPEEAFARRESPGEPVAAGEPQCPVEPEAAVEPEGSVDPEATVEPQATLEPQSPLEPESARVSAPEPVLSAPVAVADAAPAAGSSAKSTDVDPAVVLESMLNRLGSDHHRPFSRS